MYHHRFGQPFGTKSSAHQERQDVIFRKVRGILNKITPETFDKLSRELLRVGLDSPRILEFVISLIFEKALSDPKYSSLYAKLCVELSTKAPNFEREPNTPNTFCKFLLAKCEDEFERRRKATECFDGKNELTLEEFEQQAIAKHKMLGNIKFICELQKKGLLQEAILHACIQGLLSNKKGRTIKSQAEDLECLCQIMKTVGNLLDTSASKNLMDQYFDRIESFASRDELPLRIRFMLRDVIDLREGRWRPRRFQREDTAPKPITKLRSEAGYASLNASFINGRTMKNLSLHNPGALNLFDDEPSFTTSADHYGLGPIFMGPPLMSMDSDAEAFAKSLDARTNISQREPLTSSSSLDDNLRETTPPVSKVDSASSAPTVRSGFNLSSQRSQSPTGFRSEETNEKVSKAPYRPPPIVSNYNHEAKTTDHQHTNGFIGPNRPPNGTRNNRAASDWRSSDRQLEQREQRAAPMHIREPREIRVAPWNSREIRERREARETPRNYDRDREREADYKRPDFNVRARERRDYNPAPSVESLSINEPVERDDRGGDRYYPRNAGYSRETRDLREPRRIIHPMRPRDQFDRPFGGPNSEHGPFSNRGGPAGGHYSHGQSTAYERDSGHQRPRMNHIGSINDSASIATTPAAPSRDLPLLSREPNTLPPRLATHSNLGPPPVGNDNHSSQLAHNPPLAKIKTTSPKNSLKNFTGRGADQSSPPKSILTEVDRIFRNSTQPVGNIRSHPRDETRVARDTIDPREARDRWNNWDTREFSPREHQRDWHSMKSDFNDRSRDRSDYNREHACPTDQVRPETSGQLDGDDRGDRYVRDYPRNISNIRELRDQREPRRTIQPVRAREQFDRQGNFADTHGTTHNRGPHQPHVPNALHERDSGHPRPRMNLNNDSGYAGRDYSLPSRESGPVTSRLPPSGLGSTSSENFSLRPSHNPLMAKTKLATRNQTNTGHINTGQNLPAKGILTDPGQNSRSSVNRFQPDATLAVPPPTAVPEVRVGEGIGATGTVSSSNANNTGPQNTNKAAAREMYVDKTSSIIQELFASQSGSSDSENLSIAFTKLRELKIPKGFQADSLVEMMKQSILKSDQDREILAKLVCQLVPSLMDGSALLNAFKNLFQQVEALEIETPKVKSHVASLLSHAIANSLITLEEVADALHGGKHHPLFLLCLQKLEKSMGQTWLSDKFNASDIKLISMLPESDRSKERLASILKDRCLGFLYPMLTIEPDLWRQMTQQDGSPTALYRWIKDNVNPSLQKSRAFATVLSTCLLRYITQVSAEKKAADGNAKPEDGNNQQPKSPLSIVDQCEKEMLQKYQPILQAILNNKDMQLETLYTLQDFYYHLEFPKGALLRWFLMLYDLGIVDDDVFLRWKEEINDQHPGKGKALFQVNSWLNWLAQPDSDEEEEEES